MATTSYFQLHRCSPISLSLSSRCSCPCRPSPSKTLVLTRHRAKLGHLDLLFDGNRRALGLGRNGALASRRLIAVAARAEPERLSEDNAHQVLEKERDDFDYFLFLNFGLAVIGNGIMVKNYGGSDVVEGGGEFECQLWFWR